MMPAQRQPTRGRTRVSPRHALQPAPSHAPPLDRRAGRRPARMEAKDTVDSVVYHSGKVTTVGHALQARMRRSSCESSA
jgi:hypothetical protein